METCVSKKGYISFCTNCGDVMWLEDKDFILLNGEILRFHICDACGCKMKIMKGEDK